MEKETDEEEEIMKKMKDSNGSPKNEKLEQFLQDSQNPKEHRTTLSIKDANKEVCQEKHKESTVYEGHESAVLQSCTNVFYFGIWCLFSYWIGYIGWSVLWILVGLFVMLAHLDNKETKKKKSTLSHDIAIRGEERALQSRFSELPSWVQFSDVSRVEWINKILAILWPQLSYFMDYFLRHTAEPLAREALEAYKLWDFKFQQINFGKIPPRISGVKVQGEPGSSEIIVDLDFEYNGDIEVSISVLKISSSVSDVQIQGKVRIVLKPIIEDVPFIGGVQMYFLKPPEIDFDLGGAASFLDLPGLNSVIKQLLNEYIEMNAVLPNKINVVLSDKISPLELKMPQPVGLIIVEVVEAKGLPSNMDFLTPIDPYVIIRYGSFELKTTVKSGSNPVWNEKLYFPIEDLEFQDLNLTVFDRDVGSADDFSGSTKIHVQSIVKNGKIDEWVPLENVPSGSIHLKISWSQVRSEPVDNATLLCVFLDSVSVGPRYSQRPNLRVSIKAGEYARETQNLYIGEANPKFHEGFVFYIENYDRDDSRIKFTLIDNRGNVNVSSGAFLITQLAVNSRKNLSVSTHKLNDSESTISFAAQIHPLDKNINNRFAESVQALLSSGSKRLVKGLGSHATGAARDVSDYAKNVKSVTGTAIKNLGSAASNKIISTSLCKKDDHEITPALASHVSQNGSSAINQGITGRSIKEQIKSFLRL